ncbi:hypothetical protein [Deinococcus hopiensis]|uniref:hypothetical protein n=1 Tax=Deinococcus hopiensis TaxID=309885 RepID=UPI000A04DE97|nr:hypothetical protein [Deinococcus hopiensis]
MNDPLATTGTAQLSAYASGQGIRISRGGTDTTRTSTGADADGASLDNATMQATLGTLLAGETVRVCFQVTIR